ncbi:MAG TPA: FecR domain-containing protein, partial [Rhizomicrobium sp.]|nr:FecR domain-containing protein [Rhizomicrobium sp.]
MTDIDRIEEEASLWVIGEDRGLSDEERERMALWLDASTAHRVAYLKMQDVWGRADRLAALRVPQPMRQTPVERGHMMSRLFALAAVLTVFVAGAGWYYYTTHSAGEVYATGVGQQQTVRLDDGTSIELNTDSRIQARVTETGRTMRLERGEAYFEVVHDARRPFVVFAGNRKITDIGTKFSVRLDRDQVHVLVSEGEVRVESLDRKSMAPTVADAGTAVVAQGNGTLVANRAPRDVSREMSWRSGVLVFDQETLAAAAEEFNRYNRKKVVVVGQAREVRVGGRFRANNADVFASLIQAGMGLNV